MNDFVAMSRFLAGMTAADVQAVLAQATLRRFPPNSVVTHQSATAVELFLITKGRARHFYTTPDGQKILLFWLTQGEVFGGATLLAERSESRFSTETVKDTWVLVWNRVAIRPLAERYPRITENAPWIASDTSIIARSATPPHGSGRGYWCRWPLLGRTVPGGVELTSRRGTGQRREHHSIHRQPPVERVAT